MQTRIPSPLASLHQVSKTYGQQQVLQPLDLSLVGGQTLALLGHNGAGKTTLIKLICGLIEASGGEITFDIKGDWRRQLGYLPENIRFSNHLRGIEILRFFARLKSVDVGQCEGLLDQVGLAALHWHRPVREYSKGMRQRLGLAQALLGQPRILLLDEPTSGLDPQLRCDIYGLLNHYKNQGCALLISSHSLEEIEHHCDRIAMLRSGFLIAQGSRTQLLQESGLTTHIKVLTPSAETLIQQLESDRRTYGFECQVTSQDWQTLDIETQAKNKKQLLYLLAGSDAVTDISVLDPGLSQLYSFYTRSAAT